MINKSLPHTKLQNPTPPPTRQLPQGISPNILIGLNDLGQATSHLLAGWLNLNPDYARKLLKRLQTDGFVKALFADNRKHQRVGSVPPVYVLSAKGRESLRRLGIAIPKRFKAGELAVNPHRLAENHMLVAARVLERENASWLRFTGFRTETWFYQHPLKVTLPDGKTVLLRPDLWLAFEGVKEGKAYFLVEVNCTEVTEAVWREKVRTYLYCLEAYRKMFGTANLTVVVIVATRSNFPKRESKYPDSRAAHAVRSPQAIERVARMQFLKEATEKELIAQNATHEADMFLFTYFALDRATPTELFLEPNFEIPSSDTPTALIPVKEETQGA